MCTQERQLLDTRHHNLSVRQAESNRVGLKRVGDRIHFPTPTRHDHCKKRITPFKVKRSLWQTLLLNERIVFKCVTVTPCAKGFFYLLNYTVIKIKRRLKGGDGGSHVERGEGTDGTIHVVAKENSYRSC